MGSMEFIKLVDQMRRKQKDFFRTKNPALMYEAKRLEKQVDGLIEEMLRPGLFDDQAKDKN